MNVLFQLGHPAHYHLFKHPIARLRADGHNVHILIRRKDILEDLLLADGQPYVNILPGGRKSLWNYALRLFRVWRYAIRHRVDVLVGSTPEVAQVAWLLHRRSVIMAEDDAAIVPQFVRAVRPFVDLYLSPISCNNGPLEKHTTHYAGFQKLAYLHPHQFTPDIAVVHRYLPASKPYFLLRFASLQAYHDRSAHATGIDNFLAQRLIDLLKPHGDVYITSERPLPESLDSYRLHINPLDIHHLMAFAALYIGDSQSMAVEAAMLGTPAVRFNDFVGQIGVLEEIEKHYHLCTGIPASQPDELFATVQQMIATPNLRETYAQRRQQMLEEKIDVAQFIVSTIENLE